MRIVCIADTHELHRELAVPPGDLLIHAGDITVMSKRPWMYRHFNIWLGELPHGHKIVIPGNNGYLLEDPKEHWPAVSAAGYVASPGGPAFRSLAPAHCSTQICKERRPWVEGAIIHSPVAGNLGLMAAIAFDSAANFIELQKGQNPHEKIETPQIEIRQAMHGPGEGHAKARQKGGQDGGEAGV
jgi:hypothetical protein